MFTAAGGGIASATDCDDTDAEVGGPALHAVDEDGDGYGTGATVVGCTGPEVSAIEDGDCDADGDGFGAAGSSVTHVVAGNACPPDPAPARSCPRPPRGRSRRAGQTQPRTFRASSAWSSCT